MNEIIKKYRQRRDARVKNHCDADSGDLDWITVKGSHVPLEGGKSAGGWSKGRDFSRAVSKKGFKSYGESNVKHAMEKQARRERNGKPAPDTNSNAGKNWSGSNYGKVKLPSKKSETGASGSASLELKTRTADPFTPELKPEWQDITEKHELIRGANTGIDHTALTKKFSDICNHLNNGGSDKDYWKEYRNALKDAPVGTVVEETGDRGVVFQSVKTGEDEWTHMASKPGGEGWKSNSKTMSMSLAGRDIPAKIEFKNAEDSLSPDELSEKYYGATSGQLDQWLRGAQAKRLGRY